jgi:hypothetical protein
MTDDALVDGFEGGTLAPAAFHHREHVRLTWLLLTRLGRAEAERRLLAGLRALAIRAGKPEKFDAPLTLAWVAVIEGARLARPDRSFDELVSARPDLIERGTVRLPAAT